MQDNFPLQRERGDQGNSCIFLIEWTEGNPQWDVDPSSTSEWNIQNGNVRLKERGSKMGFGGSRPFHLNVILFFWNGWMDRPRQVLHTKVSPTVSLFLSLQHNKWLRKLSRGNETKTLKIQNSKQWFVPTPPDWHKIKTCPFFVKEVKTVESRQEEEQFQFPFIVSSLPAWESSSFGLKAPKNLPLTGATRNYPDIPVRRN